MYLYLVLCLAALFHGVLGHPISKRSTPYFTSNFPASYCINSVNYITWTGGSGSYNLQVDVYFADGSGTEYISLFYNSMQTAYFFDPNPYVGSENTASVQFFLAEYNTPYGWTSPVITIAQDCQGL